MNNSGINEKIHRHNVPTIFAIFGVTGDLAQKKIFPALIDLYQKKLLPEKFAVVGIARRDISREDFQKFVRDAVLKKKTYDESILVSFLEHVQYSQGNFDVSETYINSQKLFDSIDAGWGQCSNKLFYLSVPPVLYELILNHLADSGLSVPCDDMNGWTRILIEKPFGKDVETAQKLDILLGTLFKEEQVYRIDHYLEKQTLQNILAFRFSNTLFEPLWNRKHIESVDIKLFESNTAKGRGVFYDDNGALRDVGQNHLLQMLALIAMEQPKDLHCSSVRKERARVFTYLQKYTKKSIKTGVVRAQYNGFRDEEGVAKDSDTETFFSLVARIKNRRWRGVPFRLTSGKALKESRVEIIINFKDATKGSFMPMQHEMQEHNKLTISIQPEEKIAILFWVKVPGFEHKIEPKELYFSYHEDASVHIDAYEKVLFDCIAGDQTSFINTAEVKSSWKFIMSVKDNLRHIPLHKYHIGDNPEDIMSLSNNL